jgi:hypothetical protein
MPVAEDLLEILRCPESKAPLIYFAGEDGGPEFLFCPDSRLKYRIEEGIPVMLVDEAERLDEREAGMLLDQARARGLASS